VRLFRVARARIVYEIEDNRHGFYLRLRARPRKVTQLCFSDRTPDQKKYDGPYRGSDQISPEIRNDFEPQFFKKEAADDRAHESHGEIVHQPSASAENLSRKPSGKQSDDDPRANAHGLLPN